jgi:hypothetical protein
MHGYGCVFKQSRSPPVLEWRHIDVEIRDNQPILHFRLQRGKRGARNFVAHHSCWLLLERLRQLSPDMADLTLEEAWGAAVMRPAPATGASRRCECVAAPSPGGHSAGIDLDLARR